jgi:uncharacterized protein DUF1360
MEPGGDGLWLRLVIAALATWRVTHLLAKEDGPFDAVARLRSALGKAGRVLDCFYCVSLWVSAPIALLVTDSVSAWVLAWLALSGAACLLDRATEPSPTMQSMRGDEDVMLWTEAGRDGPQRSRDPGEESRGD